MLSNLAHLSAMQKFERCEGSGIRMRYSNSLWIRYASTMLSLFTHSLSTDESFSNTSTSRTFKKIYHKERVIEDAVRSNYDCETHILKIRKQVRICLYNKHVTNTMVFNAPYLLNGLWHHG